MQLRLIAFALLTTLALSCVPLGKTPGSVEVLEDVEYGRVRGRALHLAIARPKHPPTRPMPAVLWFHGGAWQSGSYRQNFLWPLATNGYFTASVEYRLSGEAKWPAQIEDAQLAVHWLRENAAKYHVDPARIGIAGFSSGGHLAACLGTMDAQAGFKAGGHTNVSSQVQAVVDLSGPAVFVRAVHLSGAKTKDSPVLVKLFGGAYREKPELWQSASPINYVTPDDPPFLVIHGEADKRVSIEDSEELVAALHRVGVPVELIRVKNGSHLLLPAWFWQKTEPDLDQLRRRVTEFFDQHLKR